MYHQEINYEADLPSRNINLFKNHRFLILVKSTGISGEHGGVEEGGGSKSQSGMETVDMAKIMGINYFRQLDSMRLGTN